MTRFRSLARRGFTLIELLVVISIIVILMSILLPAIRLTLSVAGQGLCAKNIHGINQAFHSYSNDYKGHIPLTNSWGNNSLWYVIDGLMNQEITLPSGEVVRTSGMSVLGLGCLWHDEFIEDEDLLFCPGADHNDRPSQWHFRHRPDSRDRFAERMDNMQRLTVTDYTPGYASANYELGGTPGYNVYPGAIIAPEDKLENLRRVYLVWLADVRASIGPVAAGQYSTHNRYGFINFGNVDGATRSVIDVAEKEPTPSEKQLAGCNPRSLCDPVQRPGGHDMWWFRNGRAPMGFWHWHGPGFGF